MTAACIDSIFKYTKGISFEVILVDNASIDNSKAIFSKDQRITYIYETINHGFGVANNIGVVSANGKYLFFLNSDTLLLNNAIYEFWNYSERLNKDVVVGSYLVDRQFNRTHSYSAFLTPQTEIKKLICPFKNFKSEDYKDSKTYKAVDYVTGADLFIKKSLFLESGGFYKGFFMYFEETDLQCRIARAGYERHIISGPKIMHLEGGSFSKNNKRFVLSYKKLVILTSKLLYFKRNYKNGWYFVYRLLLPISVLPFFITNSSYELKKKLLRTVFS